MEHQEHLRTTILTFSRVSRILHQVARHRVLAYPSCPPLRFVSAEHQAVQQDAIVDPVRLDVSRLNSSAAHAMSVGTTPTGYTSVTGSWPNQVTSSVEPASLKATPCPLLMLTTSSRSQA